MVSLQSVRDPQIGDNCIVKVRERSKTVEYSGKLLATGSKKEMKLEMSRMDNFAESDEDEGNSGSGPAGDNLCTDGVCDRSGEEPEDRELQRGRHPMTEEPDREQPPVKRRRKVVSSNNSNSTSAYDCKKLYVSRPPTRKCVRKCQRRKTNASQKYY